MTDWSQWEIELWRLWQLENAGKLTMTAVTAAYTRLGCTSLGQFLNQLRAAGMQGGRLAWAAEKVAAAVGKLMAAGETGAVVGASRWARAGRLVRWAGRGLISWAVLKWLLGLLALGAVIGMGVWLLGGDDGDEKEAVTACPSPEVVTEKCPWTPEGYSVEPCAKGMCWDGGPQGPLACKQAEAPANSHRTETSNVLCDQGYEAVFDPCTPNLVLECN